MQNHFHENDFALRLALKQRHKGTLKWPIEAIEDTSMHKHSKTNGPISGCHDQTYLDHRAKHYKELRKVPKHEIPGAQHLSLYEKSQFF